VPRKLFFLLIVFGVLAIFKFLNFMLPQSAESSLPTVTTPSPAVLPSQAIIGQASVIDGDTIEIHRTRIRLFGMDAPESAQTCTMDGKTWPCGRRAAFALSDKIASRTVECRPRDRDQYGRVVAVCFVGGEDVNAWMVSEGWALAFRRFSYDYVGQERQAANAKRGMWAGDFDPPWDWRRDHPRTRPAPRLENSSPPSKPKFVTPPIQ
jgi:endonuclease YncB( thermonuclease family)